ncbi:MAG: GGDEF domain-containing protein [Burkholderiales bacterium]|nr:GGDEF domain-containing protein [Burkholderiales bacterium]
MQVRHLAIHDGLTGLARRAYFIEQVKRAVAQAHRHKEQLAVLFLDLDGFKSINDTLGHDAGDELLKAVANRLRETVRDHDTIGRDVWHNTSDSIARFGGDEFVILLDRLNDVRNAAQVGARILSALALPYTMPGGHELTVTSSVGIAIYPQDGTDADQLIKSADSGMYAAKSAGKNILRMASDT